MMVGVQTGGITDVFGQELGYKMIREAGFTAIDWNLDHALPGPTISGANEYKNICIFERSLEDSLAYYSNELALIKENGLTISQAHAPFPPYLPERPESLDYMISIYKNLIIFCNAIKCKNLVIHGISHRVEDNISSDEVKALNMKLYGELIDTLKETNVTVCLENLPIRHKITSTYSELVPGICADPYEAVEYIDTLNAIAGKECFGFCLDTGHLNICKTRFEKFVPILGKRIKALHIHDNSATSDDHTAPYSGTLIWNEFLTEMKSIGYDGDLSFETFRQIKFAPNELAPSFLKLISDVGYYFKNYIEK